MSYAIVESENKEAWSWFLSQNQELINLNSKSVSIISDRDKGLVPSLDEVLPLSRKLACCRHLSKNILIKFKSKNLNDKFWELATCLDSKQFLDLKTKIEEDFPEFYQYLMNAGLEKFCSIENLDLPVLEKTSNNSESLNSTFKKFKKMDILSLVMAINEEWMEKIFKRRNENRTERFTKFAEKTIKNYGKNSQIKSIVNYEEGKFLVNKIHKVDLGKRDCTCFDFIKEKGLLCKHLMAVANYQNIANFEEKIDSFFLTGNYKLMYDTAIEPILFKDLKTSEIEPPVVRAQKGRPRVNRYKSCLERKRK